MDHETLFTASKWDILKHLERGPSSPLALSKICGTSIANVSQQLRLLEMAGIVTSERISNRDKGKPRVLYSLAGDLSYLISTSGNFVEKKTVHLSKRNKAVMKIWFYPVKELHYALEKTFWKIEEHFDKLSSLSVDMNNDNPISIYVSFKGKPVTIQPFTIKDKTGQKHQVVFTSRKPKNSYTLYDTTKSGDEQ